MVRVLFVHPDLGIGGAERLVVDAAIALKNIGHSVSFLTNHHDHAHCFEETRNGMLQVTTVGDWLPRNIYGKFSAMCAYIRMIYAAFYTVVVLSKQEKIDMIFCDQISAAIPIFKLAANKPKILFYCHFPDQLLASDGSALKRLYRKPLNYLEEKTTGCADCILVNSKFTRRIFKETFRSLDILPVVLYPSLNTDYFDNVTIENKDIILRWPDDKIVFLSINRYERKKNLPLAIKAFKLLENYLTKREYNQCALVMAGGYDLRVVENVTHYDELVELADRLNISTKITFLRSFSDKYKIYLLKTCEALLYTPENEHFGIVPLESMYLQKPVIAVNSGGPTETIIHESTGFLCDKNEDEFAKAMAKFVKDRTLSERMGTKGQKHVQQKFSFDSFSSLLDCVTGDLCSTEEDEYHKL